MVEKYRIHQHTIIGGFGIAIPDDVVELGGKAGDELLGEAFDMGGVDLGRDERVSGWYG
jgi:hypothetical protein